MVPYVLLILISLFFSCVLVKVESHKKYTVSIGITRHGSDRSICVLIFFGLLILLLALRNDSVGRDVSVYKEKFIYAGHLKYSDIITVENDVLYYLLNWIIRQSTDNFQWLLIITSLISVLPIAYVYSEDSRYGYLKVILFANLTPFIMIFSGVRQSIAMGISMIAYLFVKEKKFIPYILTVLVAIGFHHSAFISFFMYPIYYVTFKKKHLLFIIPFIMGVLAFNKPIFVFFTEFLSQFSDEYSDVTATETGALGSLVLFIIFAVFCYLIPDESKMAREVIGLRNLLLFAVLLQCFAPLHSLAMRFNYYYILFIPLTVAKVLTVQRGAYKQIAIWGYYIITMFFTFLFFQTQYTSYVTGISTLDTVPYLFFWE